MVATDRKPEPGLKPRQCVWRRVHTPVATDRKPEPGLKHDEVHKIDPSTMGRDGSKTRTGIETRGHQPGCSDDLVATDRKPEPGLKPRDELTRQELANVATDRKPEPGLKLVERVSSTRSVVVATDRKPEPGLKPMQPADRPERACGRDGSKTRTGIETGSISTLSKSDSSVATDRKPEPGLKLRTTTATFRRFRRRDGSKTRTGIETPPYSRFLLPVPRRDGSKTRTGIETDCRRERVVDVAVATDRKPEPGLKLVDTRIVIV